METVIRLFGVLALQQKLYRASLEHKALTQISHFKKKCWRVWHLISGITSAVSSPRLCAKLDCCVVMSAGKYPSLIGKVSECPLPPLSRLVSSVGSSQRTEWRALPLPRTQPLWPRASARDGTDRLGEVIERVLIPTALIGSDPCMNFNLNMHVLLLWHLFPLFGRMTFPDTVAHFTNVLYTKCALGLEPIRLMIVAKCLQYLYYLTIRVFIFTWSVWITFSYTVLN